MEFLPRKKCRYMVRVTIISTGSELVNGAVVDTNSAFISGLFFASNFNVARHITVGDSRSEIFQACRASLLDSQCVIMSGGLGPTDDDLTVDIIAGMSGREVIFHEKSMEKIYSRFSEMRRTVSGSDMKMAAVPEGLNSFFQQHGPCPGLCLRDGGFTVYRAARCPAGNEEHDDRIRSPLS